MAKILKNTTGAPVIITDVNRTIPANASYTITGSQAPLFADSVDTLILLRNGTLVGNNGTEDLEFGDASRFITGDVASTSEELPEGILEVDAIKIISQANVTDLLTPQQGKTYYIDGIVDIGTSSISVPPTGITLHGLGFDISKIISSEDSTTLFTGTTAGNFFVAGDGLTFSASGIGAQVFDLVNSSGFSALELNFVNFESCTSLGTLDAYRQMLGRNVGYFSVQEGITYAGNWVGGIRMEATIARNSSNLFIAGPGLVFNGRVGMNLNVDLPAGTSFVTDFSPTNFAKDLSLQLNNGFYTRAGVRNSSDPNLFPNISSFDNASLWTGNSGLKRTIINGSWTMTGQAATVITTQDVFVKVAGVTTIGQEDHTEQPESNRILNPLNDEIDYDFIAALAIELTAGSGDVVRVKIRVWDDSESVFVDYAESFGVVPNLVGGFDVLNINVSDIVTLDTNDYVELAVANGSDTTNIVVNNGSYARIRRL